MQVFISGFYKGKYITGTYTINSAAGARAAKVLLKHFVGIIWRKEQNAKQKQVQEKLFVK